MLEFGLKINPESDQGFPNTSQFCDKTSAGSITKA
jgi:hypothetical protein